MKKHNLPNYPSISRDDLSKLTLDPESAKRFERRYYPRLACSLLLVLGGSLSGSFLAPWIGQTPSAMLPIVSFIVGLAVIVYTQHRRMRDQPVNVQTQNPMVPFKIEGPGEADRYELAYVDHLSGTYFTRVYVERD